MPIKPPHLETEEEIEVRTQFGKSYSKIGLQGPSKYGKGGSRVHKAKGKSRKK